jgi:gliding motility-associated lipoprotein GldH
MPFPMIHGKKIIFILLISVGFLVSCDRNRVFEENIVIPSGVWNSRHKVEFSVQIDDQMARYNIYLNVRNAPEYPYSNLFLFLDSRYPDGRISRDTIELTLADYDGRWLGSGMGGVKFNRFLFHRGVKFQQKGNYRFSFEQAMRVNELKGIRDFGLRIEKQ